MRKKAIALQLYSLREDCRRDLQGTLEAVADIGYDGVEFAGYHGKGAEELREMLDGVGLKVAGSHVGIQTLMGKELERSIEFSRVLGNKYLIVPSLPEEVRKSTTSWLEAARKLNEIAERLTPEEMRVGYHNHAVEFQPVDGKLPWDIMFGATVQHVVMQLDTGNAMGGGISSNELLEILKRYPGRATTVHLKDFSSSNDKALIGEGEVKWLDFFSLCETIGSTEWYIVEQERYPLTPLESVRICKRRLDEIMGQ